MMSLGNKCDVIYDIDNGTDRFGVESGVFFSDGCGLIWKNGQEQTNPYWNQNQNWNKVILTERVLGCEFVTFYP